ncbi:Sterol 3-beta-glucosyltransferase [Fusarium oxysporum f. sp. cubense race 1]|uniref:Sterol 3-beta-glucosyltransferase n=1 Tax=Fusarium oxysporum f. sp. cubense (strain race 1) TaxID=1229664 RepID=N4U5T6_FUSC1|nr:Sterol 3-beta-glucosyltransferase [Fusarium oxysporum f. sp. cubense race 1]
MSKSRSQSPSKGKESHETDNVLDIPWDAPPPYELHSSGSVLASTSRVNDHGGVDIEFSSLQPDEVNRLLPPDKAQEIEPTSSLLSAAPSGPFPALNVVIQVVGSRDLGDVQPFIALGVALQRYGHRVRLATHDTFTDFVRSSGLEFYPVGGDPEDLMAYMVKNPGLIPSMESLRGGDIGRKRVMIHDMLRGFWSSCFKPDLVSNRPFVADAIIANPPSFAHVHCAQALGIPLHMMFTMPWTATRSFPHPLANIQSQNMDPRASNYLSYGVVDLMTWQGLGDVINAWRVSDLHLDPLAAAVGPDIVGLMKVPYTYCWSPALVPKPSDWGESIDICGFFMRDEPSYTPPQDLADFLARGLPPVYIGTDSVFYLGDCPHEWLFKRVAAVVHHGGAGTTACGLVNGRPTTIVPFFGDQPFWGSVVASNGAGPPPIAYKSISVEKLSSAIKFCLSPEAQAAANRIASQMRQERGVETAVNSFHRHLPIANLTCELIPHNAARWQYVGKSKKGDKGQIRISNAALKVLLDAKKAKLSDFEPLRPKEYLVENERWDPLTAGASSVLGTMTDFTSALGGAFIDPFKDVKRVRPDGTRRSAGTATAVASGKALQGMTTAVVKGSLVDVPLALAEGLRNTPRLYGEKSGGTVAAKNFGVGFYEGVTDIVTKPMKGAKEEGALGFFKGVGKGSLNMVAKPGSAMFGLLAYPAQGVYKSVKSMKANKARELVAAGRVESLSDGQAGSMQPDAGQVVRRFQELTA